MIIGPGSTEEMDTCTCKHCNKVWYVRGTAIKSNPGGWCRMCMAPICPQCAGKECVPFLKKLDEYEAKQKFYREAGL